MSKILVCTDGSLYAPSIYQYAAWAAEKLRAEVQLLHVIERNDAPVAHDFSGNLGFHANEELMGELIRLDETHARVARLRGKAIMEDAVKWVGDGEISVIQRHGSLVDTVTEFEVKAELVVLGKRGEHADFAKGHLGSNLERVVRSVKIPVLVAAREFRPIQRFLIAFDGGESSVKAVNYLISRPLLRGADCHLIAVGKPDGGLAQAFDNAVNTLKNAGFTVDSDLVSGDPEEVISAKVRDFMIDLLVMGAYGHSRVRQLILGSTTTSIMRTCHVPVLLFR